jgi:hypothetical protein
MLLEGEENDSESAYMYQPLKQKNEGQNVTAFFMIAPITYPKTRVAIEAARGVD